MDGIGFADGVATGRFDSRNRVRGAPRANAGRALAGRCATQPGRGRAQAREIGREARRAGLAGRPEIDWRCR